MANEVSVLCQLTYAKGTIASSGLSVTGTFTVTGSHYIRSTQVVGTTPEALGLGDVPENAPGWFLIHNLELPEDEGAESVLVSNAYIVGLDQVAVLKIKPGEFACGRFTLDGQVPTVWSSGGSVQIEYMVVQD